MDQAGGFFCQKPGHRTTIEDVDPRYQRYLPLAARQWAWRSASALRLQGTCGRDNFPDEVRSVFDTEELGPRTRTRPSR